jgi:hypothetical protein
MPRQFHCPCLYHSSNVWRQLQIMRILILQLSVTSSPLGQDILPSTLFWNTHSLCFSLNVSDQVSHPYETAVKIIVVTNYFLWQQFLIIRCLSHMKMSCVERSHSSVTLLRRGRSGPCSYKHGFYQLPVGIFAGPLTIAEWRFAAWCWAHPFQFFVTDKFNGFPVHAKQLLSIPRWTTDLYWPLTLHSQTNAVLSP